MGLKQLSIKQKLRPSILDRVIDDSPEVNLKDAHNNEQFNLNYLKNSVRKDLENLFNSRYRISDLPEEYEEIQHSLINYGLPDLATINMIDIEKRADFCKHIEKTIRYFEPRFQSVKVKYIDNQDYTDRTLRFRIEAVLYAEPMPEKIIFDSILEPISRNVSIEEA